MISEVGQHLNNLQEVTIRKWHGRLLSYSIRHLLNEGTVCNLKSSLNMYLERIPHWRDKACSRTNCDDRSYRC